MRRSLYLAVFMMALLARASAQTVITPTTTLAAETANNTSTADTFATSSNNNLGASNISKVNLRTLLYSGATTGIYVHWMPWWGPTSHISIGYDSADPLQIKRQVDDMLSRGIDAAIVDWYGPSNTHHNTATINLMNEANLRNGQFKFAITEDGGALKSCSGSATCNLTSQLISDLTYAYNTFEISASYLTLNSRPVVFFFNPDRYGTLDWARVAASVPGNPLFIFENSGGFTHAQSSGSFSWVGTSSDPNNWGQTYLTNFYQTGMSYPSLHTVGSTKKGFNDTMASWGSYRIMNQNCGQTWLSTFSEIPTLYSATKQLESVQLVTWNDYEEGTEIESGIDNCVLLGASLAGATLNWTLLGGSSSTLDHYVVFISLDGQNLMPLTQTEVGVTSVNLASYALAPGAYTLYVKAVGKATLSNKMSNPVIFIVGDQAPVTTVAVTPASGSTPLTVSATMTASDVDGVVTSTAIDFGDGTVVAGSSAMHTYAQPGQYRVVATAHDNSGASSASATLVSATNQSPVAALSVSPSSGTAPTTITANTSGSYDPDGAIASITIDFGDGTTVTGASASHQYSAAGTYTVRATVTDNFGAFNRTSKTVTISGPAVTITSPTGSTSNSPVHLVASATSSRTISSITVYDNGLQAYTVAAGSVDTTLKLMPDEQHKLTVKAKDSGGGSGQASVTVWVSNQAPVAALSVTPASGTAPLTVSASTAASTDPDGSIASSSIDFGDGTVASGPTASHTYNSPGTFTVKATVSDGLGGYASATQQLVVSSAAVNQPPHAALSVTPNSGTAPLSVTASTSGSSDADGTIASSRIDFGDGTVLSGPTATHSYSGAGLYTVKATITDNGGLSATASANVTAAGVRITSPAGVSTLASPVHVVSSAYSTRSITAMKIYLDYVSVYSVAAGSIDTSLKMSVGAHHLTVQAWDSAGAIYKSSMDITLAGALTAAVSVTPSSGAAPLTVTASTSGSTDSGGIITSSSINFGDGTTLSGPNASHTYAAAGTYTVTASVDDSIGRSSTATATVTVAAPAISEVVVSSPANGATVSSPVHIVASANASHPITAMKIYLDYAGVFSTAANKIDAYLSMSAGSHHLTVQAWDSAGVVYKSSLSINVK